MAFDSKYASKQTSFKTHYHQKFFIDREQNIFLSKSKSIFRSESK